MIQVEDGKYQHQVRNSSLVSLGSFHQARTQMTAGRRMAGSEVGMTETC